MAVTLSLTPTGAYRSRINDTLLSIAAAGTETITLVHRLGACPHEIRFALRSTIAGAVSSFRIPDPAIATKNASQAVLYWGNAVAPATQENYDIICEFTTDLVS